MFLLPLPKSIKESAGFFNIQPETCLILHPESTFDNFESAGLLQEEIQKVLGLRLPITKTFTYEGAAGIILKKGAVGSESYELNITPENITISGSDDAGVFYGVQTLRQLVRTCGRTIQCVEINDSPSFANRGFYHDITRGKVPTLETLKKLADTAALYKINQLQLYVEHTYAFKNQSEVWAGADPLTAEEILLFDQYCRERHIELVPSLSTFGHLYEALKSYSYNSLCELEDSLDTGFSWIDRMRHHTLDVSNPESVNFIRESLEEFIPLFSSDKFNICGDETFDLGNGKNREAAEKQGKGRLYVDFIKKIMEIVMGHGKKVMFWGDIMAKHPELMYEIPQDVTCLNWDYSPEPDEQLARILHENGRDQYVCPGVIGWNKLMNSIHDSFLNISRMAAIGAKYNASGLLNTDWGDYGHINLLANSMPGLIYGAVFSWSGDKPLQFEALNDSISRLQYGDGKGKIVSLLSELSGQQAFDMADVAWWLEEKALGRIREVPAEEILKKYKRAVEIREELRELLPAVRLDVNMDMQEFDIAAGGICLFNSLALIVKNYILKQQSDLLVDTPSEMAVKLEYWLRDFSRLWRARNKESELYRIRDVIMTICKILRKI